MTEFHMSSFKKQISGRNYCKFQAETRIKVSKYAVWLDSKPYEQNQNFEFREID